MIKLKSDIASNNLKNLYLFYGDEAYLMQKYEKDMIDKLVSADFYDMNLNYFHGKEAVYDVLSGIVETLPFFADKRLVFVKESGLFTTGRKDETEKLANYVEDLPLETVLVFIEKNIDKRNSLYKKVNKFGTVVEFKTPDEKSLIKWIIMLSKQNGKVMTSSTAVALLRTVDNSMNSIETELEKLFAYALDDSEITVKHIRSVCTKSIQAQIFQLVEAIGRRNSEKAIDEFAILIQKKESPQMVIVMITRQFRLILQCSFLSSQRESVDSIAATLGIRTFIVRDCLSQATNFTIDMLKSAFMACLDADVKIKSGEMNDKIAVEMLILEIAMMK